jgi:F0F1-type ATP synthase assembly protein I
MKLPSDDSKKNRNNRTNLTIAILTGQVGVLTLVIVLAAVFGGMALDKVFGTRPWITIGLIIVSLPVSLFLMIFIARRAVRKLKTSVSGKTIEEDAIGEDS